MGKFWDILGEILAVVLVIVYALLIVNASFNFIPAGTFLQLLEGIRNYGSLALVVIVGLETISKRNFIFIFKIIFLVLCAIIVVFMFLPDTYAYLVNLVK